MTLIDPRFKLDPIVLWDLDSTLCDTQHRHWIIPEIKAHKKTWDDYSMLCDEDGVIPGAAILMRLLDEYFNVALSARSDAALEKTRAWARKNWIPLDDFILRPAGARTNIGIWKVSKIRQLQREGFDVVLLVEDNREVAQRVAAAKLGVAVLGVTPFYENDHTVHGAI